VLSALKYAVDPSSITSAVPPLIVMVPSDFPAALTDRSRPTVDDPCVTLPSIDSELAAADVLTAVETTCAALFAAMPFPAAEAGEPETTNTRNGAAVIDKEHRLMNLTLEPAIPDRVSPVMLARYGTEATRSRMGGRPAV